MTSGEAGAPWLIPAEQFEINQVKPLSLSDLAIADNVKLDKQTVAAILGVPSFVLGVGEYKQEEWNYFVKTKVREIVTGLQQEMTRKLIYSPNMYIKFNVLSVMDWDLTTIASVFGSLSDRGFVTGNEVRDKIGIQSWIESVSAIWCRQLQRADPAHGAGCAFENRLCAIRDELLMWGDV